MQNTSLVYFERERIKFGKFRPQIRHLKIRMFAEIIILIALKSQHGNIIDLASETVLSSVYHRATLSHSNQELLYIFYSTWSTVLENHH